MRDGLQLQRAALELVGEFRNRDKLLVEQLNRDPPLHAGHPAVFVDGFVNMAEPPAPEACAQPIPLADQLIAAIR